MEKIKKIPTKLSKEDIEVKMPLNLDFSKTFGINLEPKKKNEFLE